MTEVTEIFWNYYSLRFEIFTAMKIQVKAFRVLTFRRRDFAVSIFRLKTEEAKSSKSLVSYRNAAQRYNKEELVLNYRMDEH
jgi:hypothetical protein